VLLSASALLTSSGLRAVHDAGITQVTTETLISCFQGSGNNKRGDAARATGATSVDGKVEELSCTAVQHAWPALARNGVHVSR
jgi:hypothetical protein